MKVTRWKRYLLLFPAVSITTLPIILKEYLLREPVQWWCTDLSIRQRILAGLCPASDIPNLSETDIISLLEHDLISAIQTGSERNRFENLTLSQIYQALEFFSSQRAVLLTRYHIFNFF